MERIDEFRNMLLVHISELDIKPLVKEINYHPEYFPDIYQLTSDSKPLVSWRALWVCEKLSEMFLHSGYRTSGMIHSAIRRTDRPIADLQTRRFETPISFHTFQSSDTRTNIGPPAEFLFRPYVFTCRKHRCASLMYQDGLSTLRKRTGANG